MNSQPTITQNSRHSCYAWTQWNADKKLQGKNELLRKLENRDTLGNEDCNINVLFRCTKKKKTNSTFKENLLDNEVTRI